MSENTRIISDEKARGSFYTPDYIVNNVLDLSGYVENRIIRKHVIDNSCGDGAFLREIVDRYCRQAIRLCMSPDDIRRDLETYIHGIEIEPKECRKCIENVSRVASSYSVDGVNWDIVCGDALYIQRYNGRMDFVLGNPPYVRTHNLAGSFDAAKRFAFAQEGMTDLYIVFYEIGINMLNEHGVLGYITPSSFFNSVAGSYMRRYIMKSKLLDTILDLKHFQAFDATTYTTIVVLNKDKQTPDVEYYQFDEKNHIPYYVDTLSSNDYCISGNFYFASKEKLELLKNVHSNVNHCDAEVKNGYATLCDSVFVSDFDFTSKYIIPVVKASRGEIRKIIFPYDRNGHLVEEDEISKDISLHEYLIQSKEVLSKRSLDKRHKNLWYAFGRSQAINDTYKDKIAISSLLRTAADLKMVYAPAGTGVYSGLYIIPGKTDRKAITNALLNDEFSIYVSLLGKYKSGGYYTFSSKDIKAYLDYKFAYSGGLLQ